MKLAVFSESSADEAAIRILADALLHCETVPPDMPRLRARGWPSVLQLLPAVVKHLHYQTDADGLIVVADSNRSPVHIGPADQECSAAGKCRLCLLRKAIVLTQSQLRPVAGRSLLKVAVGLAMPTIEAWYLCGVESGISENAWRQGLESGHILHTRNSLKQKVYGTDRPSIELETEKAREAAQRLAGDLARLEQQFPIGFGTLAGAMRGW